MMLGVFIPERLGRGLGMVYELDAAGDASISLLPSKVAVLFCFQRSTVGTFFLNIGLGLLKSLLILKQNSIRSITFYQ